MFLKQGSAALSPYSEEMDTWQAWFVTWVNHQMVDFRPTVKTVARFHGSSPRCWTTVSASALFITAGEISLGLLRNTQNKYSFFISWFLKASFNFFKLKFKLESVTATHQEERVSRELSTVWAYQQNKFAALDCVLPQHQSPCWLIPSFLQPGELQWYC